MGILSAQEYTRQRRLNRQAIASADLPAHLRVTVINAESSEESKAFNHEVEV